MLVCSWRGAEILNASMFLPPPCKSPKRLRGTSQNPHILPLSSSLYLVHLHLLLLIQVSCQVPPTTVLPQAVALWTFSSGYIHPTAPPTSSPVYAVVMGSSGATGASEAPAGSEEPALSSPSTVGGLGTSGTGPAELAGPGALHPGTSIAGTGSADVMPGGAAAGGKLALPASGAGTFPNAPCAWRFLRWPQLPECLKLPEL